MRAKGPNNVNITKVKAHAIEEDVEEEKTTEVHKKGNDKADTAADKGSRKQQIILVGIARCFANRHERYRKLMDSVADLIINMMKAAKRRG